MTVSNLSRPQMPDESMRFCDDTDLGALGFHTEAHDWRLPANLPAKPKGLALSPLKSSLEWIADELPILQYQSDWRVGLIPLLAALLMIAGLALISFRLPITTDSLLLLGTSMLLFLAYATHQLRQNRLIVDQYGVTYQRGTRSSKQQANYASADNRIPERPLAQISWQDLVGIASQRCFMGRVLVLMSRQGVDHRIQIAYLPMQQIDQLTRLLRSQLARRAQD